MKILLVDDHTLVLRGIAHVLRDCVPGAEVTEASSTEQALEALQAEPHDIALVDIRLPGRDGLDLLREVRATWPQTPVIILTAFDSAEYVRQALTDGAAGYLLKDSSPEDLAQAIRVALGGAGNVLSPRAVRSLFDHPIGQAEIDRATHPRIRDGGLTRREWDILDLLAEGHRNREISKRLFLSEKTVKAHLAAVFRKLGVTNRTQAAMAAVAMGAHAGPPSGSGQGLGQGHQRRAEDN
jgi:DNA-binding NarL/FixJ family response regulator